MPTFDQLGPLVATLFVLVQAALLWILATWRSQAIARITLAVMALSNLGGLLLPGTRVPLGVALSIDAWSLVALGVLPFVLPRRASPWLERTVFVYAALWLTGYTLWALAPHVAGTWPGLVPAVGVVRSQIWAWTVNAVLPALALSAAAFYTVEHHARLSGPAPRLATTLVLTVVGLKTASVAGSAVIWLGDSVRANPLDDALRGLLSTVLWSIPPVVILSVSLWRIVRGRRDALAWFPPTAVLAGWPLGFFAFASGVAGFGPFQLEFYVLRPLLLGTAILAASPVFPARGWPRAVLLAAALAGALPVLARMATSERLAWNLLWIPLAGLLLGACLLLWVVGRGRGAPRPTAWGLRLHRWASAIDRAVAGTTPHSVALQGGVGPYAIEGALGTGGTANAFLARRRGGPVVVLKVQHRGHGRDRLAQEAATLRRLSHPNIVPLLETVEADGEVLMVLPYMRGGSAADGLQDGPLPLHQAVGIVRAAGEGVAAAHKAGILHADIKPANILSDGSTWRVCDFSGGRAASLGTMAPEQVLGRPLDGQVDVYGLAATLHWLVTGHPPKALLGLPMHEARRHILEPWRPRTDVPKALRPVLAAALEVDPARRPSLGVFLGQLEQRKNAS